MKAEVLSVHPSLRFAFSRPGFVTFKEDLSDSAAESPALVLPAPVFARLWGEAVDQTRDPAGLSALLARVPEGAVVHAFDRDRFVPGDEIEGYAVDEKIRSIAEVSAFLASRCKLPPSAPLAPGDRVYDLIWIDDFHVFLGRRLHSSRLSPFPGNILPLELPAHSPSHAWLKLEEALLRFNPVVQSGWQALEIGCAPGGATTALLDRGFSVTGIDPQFMAESVAARKGFRHVRKPARYAEASDLSGVNPDWIVMDMSILPKDALGELSHVIGLLRDIHGKNSPSAADF